MNMLGLLVGQILSEPMPVNAEPVSNKIEWTDEMISQLGVITDAEFAERYDISRYHVYNKRKRLGIAPSAPRKGYNTKHKWPDNESELFKRYTTREISDLLNIPYASVLQRRYMLKIEMDPTITMEDAELTEAERKLRRMAQDKERQQEEKAKAAVVLRGQGKTYQEIAKELKVSMMFISSALKKSQYESKIDTGASAAETSPLLEMDIAMLEMLEKVKIILRTNNINTLGDIVQLSKSELLMLPNFGRTAFADVVLAMEKHGLKIKTHKKQNH